MKRHDILPLREIIHSTCKRYLNVRPNGFQLYPNAPLQASVDARILSFGGARTLYANRKPQCRSLDALHPLGDPARNCRDCRTKAQCTSQLRLDLFVENQPFRLLLAYTSAKAFLLYETDLGQRGIAYEDIIHRISVINRGSWGELRFRSLHA